MMSVRFPSSVASMALVSSLVFLAAAPAFADGTPARYTAKALDAMAADAETSTDLPTRLLLASEPFELPETRPLSLAEAGPQGRPPKDRPGFIDFSHFEMGGYVGVVAFSSDFEADPSFVAGITARVPVPGIPGNWGIFAQAFVSYVSRDLPFYYDNKSGTWYGAEVGGDFTFIRDEVWYLRAQAGILYANWNGVNALDDGVGLLLGVQIGFYWIRHNQNAVVTINPQFSYDGSNWLGFFTIGFSYDF